MNTLAVGRPMEILLVEDNLMDARITIAALRDSNIKHRLTFLRDGEETLLFLRRAGIFAQAPSPDLLLLDLNLPKCDGFDVLKEIRANYDLRRLPVVVLTASDVAEDRSRCEHLDVQSFIQKPVNIDKFLAVMRDLKRDWLQDVILPDEAR